MAGLLLILALLAGFAGMLVVRLLPLGWLGLVVLTGMGGALAMLALMAASRWRARRLEGDYRRSPPDVLRGQSWTYRFYFLSGNLLPAFAFTMAVGVILLLAGPRDLAAAFLGAVAGAGTVAFLGALQGSLPASRTLRATLALCWRRMPRDVALASNQRDRGRPGGLAYLASLCWQLWRFLSSSLLLATRYRSVADEDLRSADPALPGLTRVLDRQRSGGGGRAPKLVPSGWVEPLRDTARRTFALALVTLLMLPLMWLATGLLPPPGGLAMGEQLRRLAYSREGPEGGPNSSMQRDQGSGEASAAGRSGDSSGTGQGGNGSEQSAEQGSPRDSGTESSREPGRTGEAGRPPETGDPSAQERGQGEPGDRPSEPERDTDPGQGQGSESPPASEGPTAGEEDGRQGGGQQSPSSGEEQPQPGSGKGGQSQPGESLQSEPGAGRREESSGQGESGQEGGAQGQGQSDGQGGAGQSNRESGQGQGSGQGDSGESRGDGFGRGGEDPQMDFDQPPIEVPELRPEDAVELDLPPMDEAVEPGQQPAHDPTDGRPAPAAASRDRNAPQGDQRPEKEAASQRLPNWIRALWDRLSETPPARSPKEETGRPQPRPQERPPGGQAHSIRGGTPIAKHLRSFGLDFHEQTLS